MAEEFVECSTALKTAQNLIPASEDDVRVKFCHGKTELGTITLRVQCFMCVCIVLVLSLALMSEKRKDYTIAMEGYVTCLNQCAAAAQAQAQEEASGRSSSSMSGSGGAWNEASGGAGAAGGAGGQGPSQKLMFMKELRGEVMLRIAVLKKEMGAIDQSMQMCNTITAEPFSDSIRANALCLKVCPSHLFVRKES